MSQTSHTMHKKTRSALSLRLTVTVAALLILAGCASSTHRAPVEDRGAATRPQAGGSVVAGPASGGPSGASSGTPAQPGDALAAKPPPGAENAGKPGYYSVRPGDTLIRIGLDSGQNWRDIARWSGLDKPNAIEVGQVLRVTPPSADTGGAVSRPVAAGGRVDGKPLDGKPVTTVGVAGAAGATAAAASGPAAAASPSAAPPSGASVTAPATTPTTTPTTTPATTPAPSSAPAPGSTPTPTPSAPREGDEDINWAWPANGPVATPFDDVKSKGLAISGKAGDAVLSAADGRVVYAGSGLRGYGNLVIVKHNATFLTAYAHNQALLVKEDQVVRRGQKIAEMGSSDADKVQLHFEIRRQGKPVDPARLLPPR